MTDKLKAYRVVVVTPEDVENGASRDMVVFLHSESNEVPGVFLFVDKPDAEEGIPLLMSQVVRCPENDLANEEGPPVSVGVTYASNPIELLDPAPPNEWFDPPPTLSALPHDSEERKTYPLMTCLFDYFPSALAAVANHSYLNNEKHNPGEPPHWSRSKSADHMDAALRHLLERDMVGAAWRVLAELQLQLEARGHPIAPAAR